MATSQIDFERRLGSGPRRRGSDYQRQIPVRATTSESESSLFDVARHHATDRRLVLAGAELFGEGEMSDNLFVVLDGWLFLYRILEDGRRQILDFALPGAVLGYHAHPETPFAFTAEAITDASVAVIPVSRVGELLCRGRSCAMILLEAANQSLLGAFDTLTDVGRRTAREAVANFLLRMNRRIRAVTGADGGASVPFPLRQEHIGDALGLTSVHVCRTLGKLRRDGLVEIGHGRLRIVDADALAHDAHVYSFDEDHTALAH